MKPEASRILGVLLAVLALAGLALCLLLLAQAHGAAATVGCGGSACDEVLASRWSRALGIPVAGLGTLAYAGLLAAIATGQRGIRLVLLGVIAGAALWLVFVQWVILRRFCPLCMAVHSIGCLAFLGGLAALRVEEGPGMRFRTVAWTVASFLALGLVQVYGPARPGHWIEGSANPAREPASAGRQVVFDGGKLVFDRDALPRIGPADAERVLVEFFDYPCAACRTMSGHLEALVAAHPGKVAILVLPVPLDASCNRELSATNPHPGACEISRISLAVWKRLPERFEAFHRELFQSPDQVTARRLALRLMDEQALKTAMEDPETDLAIQKHIALWKHLSKTNDKLPKLLIGGSRIVHGLPSTREDFLRVMKQELGFSSTP